MRIIVTGGTGQIGSEVLRKCIETPDIRKVFAITRRPLQSELTANAKLVNIIHTDFSTYPESLLSQLSGAECCIWSLGTTLTKGKGEYELHHGPDVEYTINAANAFVEHLQPHLGGKKFRFVYVSAWVAERDQQRQIWIGDVARKSKGEAEQKLVDLAESKSEGFELFIARPGKVHPNDTWIPDQLLWLLYAVRQDQLAAVLVDIAVNGSPKKLYYARDLESRGAELVAVSHNN